MQDGTIGYISFSGRFLPEGVAMSSPASTVKVTSIEPCGEAKVCITVELVVDVHCLADVGGKMPNAAAKGASAAKKRE